jgi:anti-sigma-K factor RskA
MTQLPTQTIAKSGFPELGPPGLRDTMRSEWTKLKTLRSTLVTLAIAAVLVIGAIGAALARDRGQPIKRDQARLAPDCP